MRFTGRPSENGGDPRPAASPGPVQRRPSRPVGAWHQFQMNRCPQCSAKLVLESGETIFCVSVGCNFAVAFENWRALVSQVLPKRFHTLLCENRHGSLLVTDVHVEESITLTCWNLDYQLRAVGGGENLVVEGNGQVCRAADVTIEWAALRSNELASILTLCEKIGDIEVHGNTPRPSPAGATPSAPSSMGAGAGPGSRDGVPAGFRRDNRQSNGHFESRLLTFRALSWLGESGEAVLYRDSPDGFTETTEAAIGFVLPTSIAAAAGLSLPAVRSVLLKAFRGRAVVRGDGVKVMGRRDFREAAVYALSPKGVTWLTVFERSLPEDWRPRSQVMAEELAR